MHKLSIVGTLKISDGEQTFPELSVFAAAAALGEIRSDLPKNTESQIKLRRKKPPKGLGLSVENTRWLLPASSEIPVCLRKWSKQSSTHRPELWCPGLSPLPWDLIDSLYLLTVQASSGSVGKHKLYRNGIFVSYTGSHTLNWNAYVLHIYGFIFKDFTNSTRSQRLVDIIALVWHFFVNLFSYKLFATTSWVHFILNDFQNIQGQRSIKKKKIARNITRVRVQNLFKNHLNATHRAKGGAGHWQPHWFKMGDCLPLLAIHSLSVYGALGGIKSNVSGTVLPAWDAFLSTDLSSRWRPGHVHL